MSTPHRFLLGAISLILFAGCSLPKVVYYDADVPVQTKAVTPAADQEGRELPFRLRVIDEIRDGKQIHIKAGVEARTPWNAKKAAVALVALREGERIGTTYYPLASVLQSGVFAPVAEGVIPAGEELTFFLSVPAQEATDYQLQLLWGKDAEPFLGTSRPGGRGAAVEIRQVEVTPVRGQCELPPCPGAFRVDGLLVNTGTEAVDTVTLGVGLVWIPAGVEVPRSDLVPAGEEKLTIAKLALAPGDSRPIRFVIDRALPRRAGGTYQPIVRIIGVSTP